MWAANLGRGCRPTPVAVVEASKKIVQQREFDPSSSVLAFFGSELRRFRTQAGLSQDRLGEIINYTGSLVGLVETARRSPSRQFAERCDAALGTDGQLARLWPLVHQGSFPSWFRGFADLEATATKICNFQAQVVPGLLQTESYARAILRAGRPRDSDEQIEKRTAARLGRQAILSGPTPPLLWVVLDEAVLCRPIGAAVVMRGQLERLATLAETPGYFIQVLPFSRGEHAALDGSLTLLSFAEGPDMAYAEGPHTGQLVDRPEQVEECALAYDLLRADALPPDASLARIRTAMEGLTDEHCTATDLA